MKSLHKIVIPTEHFDAEDLFHKALQELYKKDKALAARADKIHEHRMMSGPACSQCIAMAVLQLGLVLQVTVEVLDSK